jgi:hypothetical protein
MGQKSTFNQEDADTICYALAEGHSLLSICEAMGIPYGTAYQWEKDNPEHAKNSARARELGCHHLADECLQIADDSAQDFVTLFGFEKEDPAAPKAYNAEHVQRSKLRIDTRMRLIGKWLPKVYGDRTTLAGDPEAPLGAMTDDQLAAKVAALQAKLAGKTS